MRGDERREPSPVVALERVSVERGNVPILSDVSWRLPGRQHAVIFGPNGSGKSTVTALIGGRLFPTRGTVTVLGALYGRTNLVEHRRRLGVFQPSEQDSIVPHHPRTTALDIVCTGFDGALAAYRDYTSAERDHARRLFGQLARSGSPPADPERSFSVLSSGERRKVLLLRMLVARPELLVLDEPYESLDIGARLQLESLLAAVVAELPVTVIIVLHRVEEIPSFVERALLLKGGRVLGDLSLQEGITGSRLSALYDTPLFVGRERGRLYCVPETGAIDE